jgi:hypothetical protein
MLVVVFRRFDLKGDDCGSVGAFEVLVGLV